MDGVEYVSRAPRPPLDGLIDDLYYLEGAPPYARLTLPPSPAALLIVNLGSPFLIRVGTDILWPSFPAVHLDPHDPDNPGETCWRCEAPGGRR